MTIGRVLSDQDFREARAAEERRLRRNATRRQHADGRTRVSRRVKAVEADLRRQLRGQGRVVTISGDMLVGSLAQAVTQLEILHSQRSHGVDVDSEEITRCANLIQRLTSQLGLRPSAVEPPKPAPSLGSLLREGGNGA